MAPVLSFIVQTFVDHVHDVVEFCRAIGAVSAMARITSSIQIGLCAYELYVNWAISLICVPVGPQGSLLVAAKRVSTIEDMRKSATWTGRKRLEN